MNQTQTSGPERNGGDPIAQAAARLKSYDADMARRETDLSRREAALAAERQAFDDRVAAFNGYVEEFVNAPVKGLADFVARPIDLDARAAAIAHQRAERVAEEKAAAEKRAAEEAARAEAKRASDEERAKAERAKAARAEEGKVSPESRSGARPPRGHRDER